MAFEGYKTMKFEFYKPGYRRISRAISKPLGTIGKGKQVRLNRPALELMYCESEFFRLYYDRESGSILFVPTVTEDPAGLKISVGAGERSGGIAIGGAMALYNFSGPQVFSVTPGFKTDTGLCGFLFKPSHEFSKFEEAKSGDIA